VVGIATFDHSRTALRRDEVLRMDSGTCVEIERSRALLYSAASAFDREQPTSVLACTQAKFACSETAVRVTNEIMGVGGGSAYARRLPFDRYLRDARAGVVMGITNDVVLSNIARMLFPAPKKAEKKAP
jgi:isovaleryl-CoA dehydrogenase